MIEETTKNIFFDDFTRIARTIAIETGISADLEICFDFINSDDSIVVYRAMGVIKGKDTVLAEATTWAEFIHDLFMLTA